MSDRNLGLSNSRSHRGAFLIGAGVLCAAALALSGCSGSPQDGLFAGSSHAERLQVERDKLAKAERARKTAVRRLSAALKANKAKDRKLRAARRAVNKYRAQVVAADSNIAELEARLTKASAQQVNPDDGQSTAQAEQLADRLKASEQELLAAKQAAKKYRAELEAADKDVADLETRLAEATAPQVETEAARSALKRSEQLVESLKAKLDKTSKERDALVKTVVSEKNSLQLSCERAQQRAEQLVKELEESHGERDKLTNQLQVSLAKIDAAVKERADLEQATEKEVKTLRDELALAQQQVSKAEAAAASAVSASVSVDECSSR